MTIGGIATSALLLIAATQLVQPLQVAQAQEQPKLSSIPEGWFIVTLMPTWGPTAILLSTLGEVSHDMNTDVATEVGAASEAEKRALAATAIEDAAQYYATGKLGGILPVAIARVRELAPQAAAFDDAALVDAIVEGAEAVLR